MVEAQGGGGGGQAHAWDLQPEGGPAPSRGTPSRGERVQERADIEVTAEGAAGIVMLKRPGAGHRLTPAMRAAIAAAVPLWARNPEIYAFIIGAETSEAFCSGRDHCELAQWVASPSTALAALAEDYALVWALECFTKPTISLIDGPVMGSGVGISLYGTHRVAAEGYAFAMPATHIGFIPDHGVASVLARMPDEIGVYLALTGRSIGRADAYRLGLATHSIPRRRLGEVRAAISAAEPVDQVLDGLHEDPGEGELDALAPAIARSFGAASVEGILARLGEERGAARDWAREVALKLERHAPSALKITLAHVRRARHWDLRATLIHDFRLAARCLEGHDFTAGVEALATGSPVRWRPARLEEVSDQAVAAHFAARPGGELALASRAEMQAFRR